MKKFKKILTAAIAAAITLTATGVAASAYQSIVYTNAEFRWGMGYAQMFNQSDRTRYASASVDVIDEKTKDLVERKSDGKVVGYGGSAKAETDETYSSADYLSKCRGKIYAGGTQYSPIEHDTTPMLA